MKNSVKIEEIKYEQIAKIQTPSTVVHKWVFHFYVSTNNTTYIPKWKLFSHYALYVLVPLKLLCDFNVKHDTAKYEHRT